jgi:hypothetical protein
MDSPLTSPFLFTHRYDIDLVITALCAREPHWLNTETGEVQQAPSPGAEGHLFEITPLPGSVRESLLTHPDLRFLDEPDQQALQALIAETPIAQYPQMFGEGRAGGWLRERLKDYALEFLDAHGLIPPSLRHINRNTAPQGPGGTKIVKIK